MTTLADRVRKVWKAAVAAHHLACTLHGDDRRTLIACDRRWENTRAALRELVEAWPDEKERAEALKVLE